MFRIGTESNVNNINLCAYFLLISWCSHISSKYDNSFLRSDLFNCLLWVFVNLSGQCGKRVYFLERIRSQRGRRRTSRPERNPSKTFGEHSTYSAGMPCRVNCTRKGLRQRQIAARNAGWKWKEKSRGKFPNQDSKVAERSGIFRSYHGVHRNQIESENNPHPEYLFFFLRSYSIKKRNAVSVSQYEAEVQTFLRLCSGFKLHLPHL